MRRHDPRQDRNEAGATDLPWGNKGHAPHNAHPEKMTPSHPSSGRTAGARALETEKKSGFDFLRSKNAAIEEKKRSDFICLRSMRMKLR